MGNWLAQSVPVRPTAPEKSEHCVVDAVHGHTDNTICLFTLARCLVAEHSGLGSAPCLECPFGPLILTVSLIMVLGSELGSFEHHLRSDYLQNRSFSRDVLLQISIQQIVKPQRTSCLHLQVAFIHDVWRFVHDLPPTMRMSLAPA